jgi:hypothetical protein
MLIWANIPIPFVELYVIKAPTWLLFFSGVPLPALYFHLISIQFGVDTTIWTECYKITSLYVSISALYMVDRNVCVWRSKSASSFFVLVPWPRRLIPLDRSEESVFSVHLHLHYVLVSYHYLTICYFLVLYYSLV